jgi:16S rRNA (cytosine1402-N4)-methyltransferase
VVDDPTRTTASNGAAPDDPAHTTAPGSPAPDDPAHTTAPGSPAPDDAAHTTAPGSPALRGDDADHTTAPGSPALRGDDADRTTAADGHVSVQLEAVLQALRPSGGVGFRALDATIGAGGHSFALLEQSTPDGHLVGLDADPAALELAQLRLAPFAGRFDLLNRNFADLGQLDLQRFDAILFDLGLSSMQLESSGRGFSLRLDEPLDMRFDPQSDAPSAADLLSSLSETELERILREFGEEPRARRLARTIVQRRERQAFRRTGDLVAAVIAALGPARGRIHPATRTFQALRIAVNNELQALESGLDGALGLLKPGGRIAVISFHSLEDRIVKWRFRGWAEQGLVQVVTRKPLVPAQLEVRLNPRARSAKLRVAERVAP